MAVQKVTDRALFFKCPECQKVNEIPFSDIQVFATDDKRHGLSLPLCSCGARSGVIPNQEDTLGNHIRRIAWKRAVAAGNLRSGSSKKNANARTKEFAAFYNEPGREDMNVSYSDDTSIVEITASIIEGSNTKE